VKRVALIIGILLFTLSLITPQVEAKEVTLMDVEKVTDLLMSPGCNYMYTLTNCPSAEAAQMREIVKDKLKKGETPQQILKYFEQIYGPRVLAQPKKKGFYFIAWWFPYFLIIDIFLLVAILLYVWQKKGKQASSESQTVNYSDDSSKEIDLIIEEEIRRFEE